MKKLLFIAGIFVWASCTKPLPGCPSVDRDELESHFLKNAAKRYYDAFVNYELYKGENCEPFKNAIRDLITAYEDLIDCTRPKNDIRSYNDRIWALERVIEYLSC